MDQRETEIAHRLKAIAEILEVDRSEIISIKFNPLMPGKTKTLFGNFSTAYQSPSEYAAGLKKVTVSKPDSSISARIRQTVRYPIGRDEKVILAIKENNVKDIYWIQHETGLEIIGAVADVVGTIWTLIEIYTAIITKIKDNKQDEKSDRFYKEITKTVITRRKFNKAGNLIEEIIEETKITSQGFSLTKDELAKRISYE